MQYHSIVIHVRSSTFESKTITGTWPAYRKRLVEPGDVMNPMEWRNRRDKEMKLGHDATSWSQKLQFNAEKWKIKAP